MEIGTISFVSNASVILLGIYLLDLNLALYSIILLFVCGRVINFTIAGFEKRISVLVFSNQSDVIANRVLSQLNRGATFLPGHGAYSNEPVHVILTVISPTELHGLKQLISEIDPNAFVIVNSTLEVLGNRHKNLLQRR